MPSIYEFRIRPSILEPASPTGGEAAEEHYVSFSATIKIYSGGVRQVAEVPPRIFPRVQYLADGQQIFRETVASTALSAFVPADSIDQFAKHMQYISLPSLSANYPAKMLSLNILLIGGTFSDHVYDRLLLRRGLSVSEAPAAAEVEEDWLDLVDEAAVEALPVVKIDGGEEEEEGQDLVCSICLNEFTSSTDQDHRKIVRMPCSHLFDKDCLAQWFKRSLSCPLCRYALPTSS